MAISVQGAHCPKAIMLMGVRWSVAYPLSTRQVEERMEDRGVHVAHATINRWGLTDSPLLAEAFHQRKRPVWVRGRLDETSSKVTGQWYALSRAVEQSGPTSAVLFTELRDGQDAKRGLTK